MIDQRQPCGSCVQKDEQIVALQHRLIEERHRSENFEFLIALLIAQVKKGQQ